MNGVTISSDDDHPRGQLARGVDSGVRVDSGVCQVPLPERRALTLAWTFARDLPVDLPEWPRVRSRGEERAMVRLTRS